MAVRRPICFRTPSTDPAGTGADLVAEHAGAADVALVTRPTEGGRRLLADRVLRRRQGAAGRIRYLAGSTRAQVARDTAGVHEAVLCGAGR